MSESRNGIQIMTRQVSAISPIAGCLGSRRLPRHRCRQHGGQKQFFDMLFLLSQRSLNEFHDMF